MTLSLRWEQAREHTARQHTARSTGHVQLRCSFCAAAASLPPGEDRLPPVPLEQGAAEGNLSFKLRGWGKTPFSSLSSLHILHWTLDFSLDQKVSDFKILSSPVES